MGITTEAEADARIEAFVSKYGNGKAGLTEEQRKARMEKFLSPNEDMVQGLGNNPDKGVELKRHIQMTPDDYVGQQDNLAEIIPNIRNFPRDSRSNEDARLINVEIDANGEMRFEGIILDGKEEDPKTRSMYSCLTFDDETSARNELDQFRKGKLKAVSDRTMAIHRENNDLKPMLEDPNIDTDPDKQGQM